NALTASGIDFTQVNSADLSQGQLTGTDTDNETFEISTTANQVAVNGMNLTSVAAINAGSSAGDAITTTELVNADLTAENNALNASGIKFTNVNSADLSQGQLTGTDTKDETFEISTADKAVTVNGMNLTSVAAINAGSSAGDAITTTELVNADLTAENNALTASGIDFTQVNSADLSQGQLTGTDTDNETFEISTAANQVAVNGMNLTSVAAIDAGTSTGDAITTTELVNADLTAENNALKASGINFTNVNSADLSQGQLTGTDTVNETFEISTADKAVTVNGMNLTSVAAIDAGTSTGDAITAVVAVDATLAAAQKALTASNIAFTNINAANLNSGALNGTNTEAETFQISTALNQVNVNGIDLTNVSAIDAGTDLGDTVVTTELVNAALTSDTNAITASGINFSGLDSMDLSQGVVTGTDSSETFEISNTNNAVTVNGMSLTAVSAVNAGLSTDDVVKVATGVQATADLTAVDNQILASAITFNDVDTVNLGGGTLNGSNSENEVYVVNTTANALAVKNMQFESVNAVNGGADSIDSIATLGVTVDAQLTGADKQLLVSDITFSDISSANMSGGRLSGSDEADTIQLTSAGMAANEINFYLINSAVDIQGGDDTVIGRAGVDWTLTGTNGEINSVRYQFKNVENVDVVSEGVVGSVTAETFELGTEESQVIVNQLTLSNVSTVTADLNDTLLGTSGDDVFNVNSDTSVITNSTTFDGMENLNGGEGQDTLISNVDGLAWIINQASDGVNSLGDFLFSQFEVLNNNVGNLNLSTSLQAVFAGESLTSSDMSLNFNGQEDVIINSTYVGKNAITGNLIAHLADINASGDIDLDTEIDILNVSTNDNRSINATFVQNGDLVLRTVDVGDSGTVILDSAVEGTGLLTTETRNEVNFVAKSVSIGTGKSDRQGAGLWEGVGSSADASQLTFDVSFNLDLEALYYVTPFFPNGAPITSQLEGIESDSLISSQQSALIVTDTVQNLAQLDPAIFESLTPYIADANSIAGADNYYASSEVPSTLDTAQLAALLSSYEPTAAGGVNYDEYKLDGESEEDDEKKKLAKKLSKAGTFVADDNSDIKVAYSESGEMLGVVKDYVFQAGDSLWSLSKRYLGNGFAWTEIAKQNPSIKNPSSIADGQIIKVVVKVSDEIGQILKSAISAGGISKEGNSATLPASLRREVALP
uniref:LysM peptidoglycan-binding domain-containing protein n=1 Tax=Thalassolituus oleivorans TaxID=187493 RepID=UPI0023F575FF